MMLRHPSGAKVRCTAKKRWALARVSEYDRAEDGTPRMAVVFRTNDPEALRARGLREARNLLAGQSVNLFRLTDGEFLGVVRTPERT